MAATNEQLIERARALKPIIAERAPATESARRPLDETIEDLIEAEIMAMLAPRRWGGLESDLPTMFAVVEQISSACISTGWISSFYINHNVYPAKLDIRLQQEVYGPRGFCLMPGANAPTMSAHRVDGGWELSGRASWGSGIMNADWAFVSGRTEEGPYSFMLPASDVSVGDVWHFAGMAGTGSNDIVVDKVFVPEYRAINGIAFGGGRTEGSAQHENPLYSVPVLPLAYCTVVGVLSGGLLGAVDAYEAIVARRVRNYTGAVVKDQQHAHVMLGEFRIAADIAHSLAAQVIDTTTKIIGTRPFTLDDRLALKAKLAFLSRHCRDTVNAVMASAGASSFHLDQPLQRFWRDLNTVCSHAFWDWDATRELVGRHRLGLQPNHPLV
ncbi:acyl-CoA dehydrogenase family protein [uncultured Sphingomonas sp.]|uniref:acyl-CoA dehydrogenase family protein n=1 Tax=uncultured Sphingomonas sp. TaxID=158754 RepID=UPI0026041D37|nr:acyl-CoA dehydrogenase family protein [uncultured Sphingomonas sp.]